MGEEEYRREITRLINKCDNLHWLECIYVFVKKLLE